MEEENNRDRQPANYVGAGRVESQPRLTAGLGCTEAPTRMQNTFNFIYFTAFRCPRKAKAESKHCKHSLSALAVSVISKSLLEMSDVIEGPFPGRCGCPLVPQPTESQRCFGDLCLKVAVL